jgi:competence protein ComEC
VARLPRLLPFLAVAQSLGIWLADRDLLHVRGALAGGAASLLLGVSCGRWPRIRAACALLAAAFAGAYALAGELERASRQRPDGVSERVVEGTVARVQRFATWMRVELEHVVSVDPEGSPVPERVRVRGERTPPAVHAFEAALPGDRVRVSLRLRPPGGLRNPGAPDHERRLARAGIGAVARLTHPALHARLPEREGWRPLYALHRMRRDTAARLASAGPGGGLLRALGLGDRGGLSEGSRAAFTRLGVAHLLAVSGLHLALLATFSYAAARRALARSAALAARVDTRIPALVVALGAALIYALFSGWGIPARRALLLIGFVVIAAARVRPTRRLHGLTAAVIVVLAFAPQALFEVGAQLSFAASAALLLAATTHPAVRSGFFRRHLDTSLRATSTAIAATAPLAAVQIGVVAPTGLAANLVLVPWCAIVLLPVTLVGTGLAAVAPESGVADLGVWIAERCAQGTLLVVEYCAARAPRVSLNPDPAPAWLAVASVLALVALAAQRTRSKVLCAVAVAALLSLAPAASVRPAAPRIAFFDVGQGDATLVQGARAAVLIDAGSVLPGGFDLGRNAVVPALAALGATRLDLVVATHADLDHRGGIPAVLERVRVGAVWLPRGGRGDDAFAPVVAAARARDVPVFERGAGDAPLRLGDLVVRPLWPPASTPVGSRNDRSLVVQVEVGGRRILLPGDLEASGEAALIASGADLRADLLKLAHHGSRSSTSPAFLEAVGAPLAVASAPCAGRFSMPHPEVLARARAQHVTVWWTGRDGAVLVGLGDPPVTRGTGERRRHCGDS